ncbi:recombinase family protein [Hazenella sp. IB182357]|uniref:Recombinase family protein n=1 Tax=Polycladospora coralii TaxID=2771432 RepID=A0A926N7F1_9BACL|nr:recombinase family protein [Polycladospora coralii]MBD1371002.1 recombinase family protein [Polycladospora coralii]MBS7529941.1 recombinase family protein [Polycladospora coralii]
MDRVCMYLRKSRADVEAEARGEGETLTKHKKALLQIAKRQKLNIIKIYHEIVSGESLVNRPAMMQLLHEIERKKYEAVLVMDMDRLGRGNMREQGIILETFQKSGTKIITPRKMYDLQDEFDEEYSEFEAFMARKELKIITRRLQSGRVRSVEDGNYVGPRPPYGYQIKSDQSGRYLIPDPDQAPIVKEIFNWYTEERIGTLHIAKRLNEMGIPSYSKTKWNSNGVLSIIKNAVYIGKIQWKKIERRKTPDHTGRKYMMRPTTEWIEVEGKHEAIVVCTVFNKAQEIRTNRRNSPYQYALKNPLAGLIICDQCDATMVLKFSRYKVAHLVCTNKKRGESCNNKSIRLNYVESRLLEALYDWLKAYKVQINVKEKKDRGKSQIFELALQNLVQQEKELEIQKGNLHDLLEKNIYDEETYMERSKNIAHRLKEVRTKMEENRKKHNFEKEKERAKNNVIPKITHILDTYHQIEDPKHKNALLKSVIDRCLYHKEKNQKNDEFTLIVYPKI